MSGVKGSASPPEVRQTAEDAARWDAFVASDPDATACHAAGWHGIMEDVLGHRVLRLVAHDADGEWAGVLPLVHVRSRIFGDYLVSMPFLNDGGPLGAGPARTALAEAAVGEARRLAVRLLELRARTPVGGAGLVTSDRRITVVLDLPDDPDVLFQKGFRSKLRSQIRRPMKEGMETRFGPDQVEPFYEVFARNMRDLGTPVLPRAFFEAIVARLPENAVAGCVYHGGRPVAAGFGTAWGDEFEMTWASSVRELDRLAPNMLLYWSFMERAITSGLRTFNFGRCTPGSGTHRFKSQWGSRDVALPWAQWSASGACATPTPDGRVTRLAVSAWRRLPLGVANRIGPILSRQIP